MAAALAPFLERLEVVCVKLDQEIARLNLGLLVELKRRTGIRYSYLLIGLLLGAFSFLFLGLGATFFLWAVSWLYPAYASFRAIESPTPNDDKQWLVYWTILGVFNLLDGIADSVLSFVPLWFSAKVVFLVWLQLPQFRGAEFLYNSFLRPLFVKHSAAIESRFAAVKDVTSSLARTAGIDLSTIGAGAAGSNASGGAAAGHDAELAPGQVFGSSGAGGNPAGNGVRSRRD